MNDLIERIERYLNTQAHRSSYGCQPCNLLREALRALKQVPREPYHKDRMPDMAAVIDKHDKDQLSHDP